MTCGWGRIGERMVPEDTFRRNHLRIALGVGGVASRRGVGFGHGRGPPGGSCVIREECLGSDEGSPLTNCCRPTGRLCFAAGRCPLLSWSVWLSETLLIVELVV